MTNLKKIRNTVGRAILSSIVFIPCYVFSLFFTWPIQDALGVTKLFILVIISRLIEESIIDLIKESVKE